MRSFSPGKYSEAYWWADSECVLKWIRDTKTRFKTFIHNRLATIHDVSEVGSWRHVPSNLNLADMCSHGLNPGDAGWELFIKGPDFLRMDETHWPNTNLSVVRKVAPEVTINAFSVGQYEAKVEKDLWALRMTTKLEHWDKKLHRVAHYIKAGRALVEYHHQGRMIPPKLEDGIPGAVEIHKAEIILIREIQAKYFHEEIKFLLRLNIRDPLARAELRKQDSRLLTLNPFVVAMGVLRAGGRLEPSRAPLNRNIRQFCQAMMKLWNL
jgi:hypothetical protein